MTTTPAMPEHIWTCQIGGNGELPKGADGPMREAIAAAFKAVTGCDASYCFSGWGHPLPERYRAVVENRLPDPNAIRRECFAVLDTLPDAATAPGGDFPTLQAQPAEVSDAELLGAIARGWCHPKNSGKEVDADLAAAIAEEIRAILALRPQAVPMTEGWQEVAACPDGDVWFSLSCGHVVMGWKQGPLLLDWEAAVDHDCCSDASAIKAMPVTPPAHHGITAPAGGEGK